MVLGDSTFLAAPSEATTRHDCNTASGTLTWILQKHKLCKRADSFESAPFVLREALFAVRVVPTRRLVLPVRLPCASVRVRALRLRWLLSPPAGPGLPLPLAPERAGRCGSTPCRCRRG